jgi:hypothetical protein
MDQAQTVSAPVKHDLFTREYNLGDLLSLAWKLFSENFKTILIVTLIIYVPITLISVFSVTATPTLADGNLVSFWGGVFTVNFTIVLILITLAGVLVPLAIAVIIRKQLDGQLIDYQAALKQAVTRWLPGLATTLLMGLFLFGLFFLLIIPSIIFGVYWAFASYAVILNNKSGLAALKYSKRVVQGRWWRVLGYLIVFGLIAGMLSWAINTPLASFANNPVIYFISSLLSDIAFSFVVVASVLLFLNLEATKIPTSNTSDKQIETSK